MALLLTSSWCCCDIIVDASTIVYSPRHHRHGGSSSSVRFQWAGRRRSSSSRHHDNNNRDMYHRTTLVARTKKRNDKDRKQQQDKQETKDTSSDSTNDVVTFRDLGPIGKTVAGVTEVVFATLFEYCSGFVTGFVIGTLVGVPGFVFRPVDSSVRQVLATEVKARFGRMTTRSVSWGKNLGSLSATFGGFGVAVKLLRNGEEDVWNEILSSAAAGAFFARKDGPQAMVRGALLYGGMIYLVSGGIGKRRPLQDYTESPLASLRDTSEHKTFLLETPRRTWTQWQTTVVSLPPSTFACA